jgi:hypothetical protein
MCPVAVEKPSLHWEAVMAQSRGLKGNEMSLDTAVLEERQNSAADSCTSVHNNHSLHGEQAAKRQALSELLFFASVGDLMRCKAIVKLWNIEVSSQFDVSE